jgi:hypothetical protein
MARMLLEQLNGKMLEFDFRNGPLRRKYDGLKYALKLVEDIVFETSLVNQSEEAAIEQDNKRQKRMASSGELLCATDFDAMRSRLEHFDALREDMIKKTRDIQKQSKQAIFSLHRSQEGDATAKLDNCKLMAAALMDSAVTSVCLCVMLWGFIALYVALVCVALPYPVLQCI